MRLFIVGDSTVQFNDITTYPQMGWGQMLHLYLESPLEINNYAKNGRSSKSFFNEGRLKAVEEQIQSGDLLLIQFGHNDEKEDEERHTDPFGSFESYLEKYVKVALDHGAKPILISPLTRRRFKNGSVPEGIHMAYPEAMKTYAESQEIAYIPLYEESRLLLEEKGEEASKAWFLHYPSGQYSSFPNGVEDDTHLSVEGAVTFAGIIAKHLKHLGYDSFI